MSTTDAAPTFAPNRGIAAPVDEAALKATRPYRIAVIVKNLVNPAYRTALKAGDDAAARYGLSITGLSPEKADDLDQQSALFAQVLDDGGYDGIVFSPVDPAAQKPLFERANRQGVGLYNISNLTTNCELVSFVGSDDAAIGRRMVEWLAGQTGGRARTLIIEGSQAPTAVQRLQGVNEGLAKQPGMQLLASRTANYERTRAAALTTELMAEHPDADAIFALNDEMALGVVGALEAAGRLSDVRVIGVNGTPDGLAAVKAGKLSATVDYALYAMTHRSVEQAVRYLNGERLAEQMIMLPFPVYDASNIEAAIAERRSWGVM